MKEIVCSHCGAVFVSATDVSICPHCGRNPENPPLRKMAGLAAERAGVILWAVWLVLILRPERGDWGAIAALYIAGAIGVGASILYFRKSSRGTQGSVTALGLGSYAVPPESLETSRTLPHPPSVPAKWSQLISLPRPRDVYWPFWSKLWAVTEVGFLLGTIGYIALVVHGHYLRFAGWEAVWPRNLLWFSFAAIGDLFVVVGIYRDIASRYLLRDGEATIGIIVDWIEHRRSLPIVVYRFWTRSGEHFEHRGPVKSDKEEYSGMGPVPVFYLPEDPSGSLALCCTSLKVRIPSEEFDARMQRAGAK